MTRVVLFRGKMWWFVEKLENTKKIHKVYYIPTNNGIIKYVYWLFKYDAEQIWICVIVHSCTITIGWWKSSVKEIKTFFLVSSSFSVSENSLLATSKDKLCQKWLGPCQFLETPLFKRFNCFRSVPPGAVINQFSPHKVIHLCNPPK